MPLENPNPFRVRLTGDFFLADGTLRYRDIGLDLFARHPEIAWTAFEQHRGETEASQTADAQAVLVLSPRVTAQSISSSENLLAIVRFGVGYDSVDVPACTAADVAVVITPGAVDRPVAEATVGWM